MTDSAWASRRPTAVRLILDELRGEVFLTRAELIERTGLSRSSVSGAVAELLSSGLLAERTAGPDPGNRRPGRPVAGLSLTSAAGLVAAVDFGHSHLSVAVADMSLRVLNEHTIDFDVAGRRDDALRAAEEEIRAALAPLPGPREPVAVGMGLPAPVLAADQSVVTSSILPGWGGSRPAAELGDRLGLPVVIDNDANLGALAEARLGAGRGLQDLLYLKVSSGIGAALILAGRVHHGFHGLAGELGHIPVGAAGGAGRACRCGGHRCLESLASSVAILEVLRPSFGTIGPARLIELADADPIVRRALTDAGRAIGTVVGDLANMLNPAAVVLGGLLADAAEPVLAGLRESLDRRTHPAVGDGMRLVAGELGERGSSLGALIRATEIAVPVVRPTSQARA
ncbi:ROK family transcriptional regulator [Actinoallomurus sp. NPDC050550]|uniref:ROK family transcriptional regulator n=1 Tax=Actinoallomurus sp. NPDC050550 TaxID=3154937 RepID=UPI0033EAD5B7